MRFPTSAVLVVLFSMLTVLFPVPSHGGVDEADQIYMRGRDLLSSGSCREAELAFERATRENPHHAEAWLQYATLLSRNILTYDKAEEIFLSLPELVGKKKGRIRDDLLFRAGVSLGKLYVKSGRWGQSIALLRNVIASAPQGAPQDEAYATLGLAYYYERFYDDAIFEMRKAIKINPDNEDARFNLKTIRSRLEHFQAAKLFSRLGDREHAVAEFRRAIELDPRFIEARHRLGVELYMAGYPAEALKELRRAAAVSPEYRKIYEIRFAEGLALLRTANDNEALVKFRQTVQGRPAFAPAHNELGKLLMERGEYDAAIDHFVKAIGADPKAEYARGLQTAMTRKAKKNAPAAGSK